MNISAQSVMKNLNVLSLEVTSPYPAQRALMNALNGLCPLAVLRAAVIIHHRPARLHVQAAQAKTAALVIEKASTPALPLLLEGEGGPARHRESPRRGGRGGGDKESMCSASVLDMMPTALCRDVP
jgi:hypothetical protein